MGQYANTWQAAYRDGRREMAVCRSKGRGPAAQPFLSKFVGRRQSEMGGRRRGSRGTRGWRGWAATGWLRCGGRAGVDFEEAMNADSCSCHNKDSDDSMLVGVERTWRGMQILRTRQQPPSSLQIAPSRALLLPKRLVTDLHCSVEHARARALARLLVRQTAGLVPGQALSVSRLPALAVQCCLRSRN